MPENTRKKAADGARPDPSGKGKQKRKRNKEADRKALEKIRKMVCILLSGIFTQP